MQAHETHKQLSLPSSSSSPPPLLFSSCRVWKQLLDFYYATHKLFLSLSLSLVDHIHWKHEICWRRSFYTCALDFFFLCVLWFSVIILPLFYCCCCCFPLSVIVSSVVYVFSLVDDVRPRFKQNVRVGERGYPILYFLFFYGCKCICILCLHCMAHCTVMRIISAKIRFNIYLFTCQLIVATHCRTYNKWEARMKCTNTHRTYEKSHFIKYRESILSIQFNLCSQKFHKNLHASSKGKKHATNF